MTDFRKAGRILVVEDDKNIATLLEKYLARDGFTVELAHDGMSALKSVQRRCPALVILDLMLPVLDGWEVCRHIREDSEVPILMLTALEQEADRIRGFSLGVDDYVVKPFSPREVVERVNNIKKSRLGGKLLFMLVELRTLMGYKRKPSRVQIDGGDWIDLELIAIFYGNCKFNGGGLRAATRAIPDDGLMDLFYVENIKSNFKLIVNLAKLYGNNEAAEKLIKKFEDFTDYTTCKTSRLEPKEGSRDILVDFDGELVGKAPLDIEIIPSAVKYFSP